MLKYTDTEVVFKEVPDEITLAINISGCPIHCPGCHSKELWKNIGDELNEESLEKLIIKNRGISCIGFMGGDSEPKEVERLTKYVHQNHPDIKVAWYSGKESISEEINPESFDFIKIGPYIEERGGLDKEGTNQIFYRVNKGGDLEDITERFKPRF